VCDPKAASSNLARDRAFFFAYVCFVCASSFLARMKEWVGAYEGLTHRLVKYLESKVWRDPHDSATCVVFTNGVCYLVRVGRTFMSEINRSFPPQRSTKFPKIHSTNIKVYSSLSSTSQKRPSPTPHSHPSPI
jgi:hypothetical protein